MPAKAGCYSNPKTHMLNLLRIGLKDIVDRCHDDTYLYTLDRTAFLKSEPLKATQAKYQISQFMSTEKNMPFTCIYEKEYKVLNKVYIKFLSNI